MKTIRYMFVSDPGHGWLAVPATTIRKNQRSPAMPMNLVGRKIFRFCAVTLGINAITWVPHGLSST